YSTCLSYIITTIGVIPELGEFQNIAIEKADCEDTSFPSGSFDTVFVANTINTVENPLRVLRESCRMLKADGLLIIVNYTIFGMKWTEKLKHIIRFLRKYGIPPTYIRTYSPEGLARLTQSAGFGAEELRLIGDKAKAVYLKARKGAALYPYVGAETK
ncbi:class I SAM-dependent methyltransferase, partial [Candidatus Poribacteria bacterium]